MTKRIAIYAVIAAALGLLAGCAELSGATKPSTTVISGIQTRGQLTVGTAASMPPLNMTTKDGKIIGLEIEIAEAMAEAMGVSLKVEKLPFAELLPALEAGRVDMVLSGMTMTPQRNLKAAFVGPYFVSGKCVVTKSEGVASTKQPDDINSPSVKLAALAGSTSQAYVETFIPQASLIKVKDYDEGLRLVFDDQADALVAEYPTCLTSLVRYPDKGLVSVVSLLSYEPLGVALPGNDPLLVNWVENFLNRLTQTKFLDGLQQRWFEDGWWLKELP